MFVPIKIENIHGAKTIVEWATKQPFEVYLSTGANVMINAKSTLGTYAMIGKEIRLVVGDHVSEHEFTTALQELMY